METDYSNISYKEYHENYLSNHIGGGLLEVPLVLSPVVLLGFHSMYLRCFVGYKNHLTCFLLDFVDVVLPSTLFVTVMYDHLPSCFLVTLTLFVVTVLTEISLRQSSTSLEEALNAKIDVKRRPFITNFKSIVSLLSVICILSVDFTIFPKSFIKTESYGYSLMDTGVGFFVMANALTCNLNEKNGLTRKSFISNVPILILGLIRYVSTEKINYQKHVTEYGVHWNFFFTLAVVKFLGPFLASKCSLPWLAVWLGVHEALLKAGLEPWVMGDAPRTGLLSANREGIVSILGYLSLYVIGVHMGAWLLYSTPKPQIRHELKNGLKCIAWYLLLTAFLHFSGLPSSRRLANPAFVIWMTSISLYVLGIAILMESLIALFCRRKNCGAHHESTVFVLEAISTNNLAFFLIGNLLTGAVNVSMKTLLVPPSVSLLIIIIYICAATGIICFIYSKKIVLKRW